MGKSPALVVLALRIAQLPQAPLARAEAVALRPHQVQLLERLQDDPGGALVVPLGRGDLGGGARTRGERLEDPGLARHRHEHDPLGEVAELA